MKSKRAAEIYLGEIRKLSRHINQINSEIEKLRRMQMNITPKLDSSPVQSSGNMNSRDSALSNSIIDYERELVTTRKNWIDAKQEARAVIDLMEHPKYQVFLRMYYIDCEKSNGKLKSLEEVAEELGLSYRHVFRIKKESLKEFSKYF